MSLEYYDCDNCGATFSAISWNAFWCECGGSFCSEKCAQKQGDGSCRLCRLEVVRDEDLLSFLFKHYNITREQAVELYRSAALGIEAELNEK